MGPEDWFPSDDPQASLDDTNAGGRPAAGYRSRGNRRLECPACGFYATTSAKQIRGLPDLPLCGCGERMAVPLFRDRFALDPVAARLEVEDSAFRAARQNGADMRKAEERARVAYNDELRASGLGDYVVPKPDVGRRGGSKRCEYGNCRRYTAAMYCHEHENHRPELAKGRRSL